MNPPGPVGIALFFAAFAASAGCGNAVADSLRGTSQSGEAPAQLVVIYDDHDREHGGDRIEIHGDGELRGDRWRPGESEHEGRFWEGRVPPASVEALVQLLVEIRAWEQEVPKESDRLNDRRARLTIRIGDERSAIWEYRSDLEGEGRIYRIKTHLDALSFEVRQPMVDGATDGLGGDRVR